MKRDFTSFGDESFDVLVVGGGIHGACVAWDATLRGLKVGLVEQGDFGGATSANSLKTIHGGLRYLQSLQFGRMRESIRERSTWLRIAPQLVRPLPFLVPTYGWASKRGKLALGVAGQVADWIGFDRNRGLDSGRSLPASRILSQRETLAIFAGFDSQGLNGGALWYDAQAVDTERLTLALLISAAQRGAHSINYVRVEGLIRDGDRVVGAHVRDRIGGHQQELRARSVVNAGGPWLDALVDPVVPRWTPSSMALAVNLILNRRIADVAIGIRAHSDASQDPVCGGRRYLFLTPWGNHTLIGTAYHPISGSPDGARAGLGELKALLDECNEACPALSLRMEEIHSYHCGLVPLKSSRERGRNDALAEHSELIQHPGLISLRGTKYTTARHAAERAVDALLRVLGHPRVPCLTAETALSGCELPEAGHSPTLADGCSLSEDDLLHTLREEMAVKLSDVVLRRTSVGKAGCPEPAILRRIAGRMAVELKWDEHRQNEEVGAVLEHYRPLQAA